MKRALLILALLLLALLAGSEAAQGQGESYDLSWWTVDGGGGMGNTGDSYTLGGTAGQPDAGELSGDSYTLNGGFWGGAAVEYKYKIHLPIIMKNYTAP